MKAQGNVCPGWTASSWKSITLCRESRGENMKNTPILLILVLVLGISACGPTPGAGSGLSAGNQVRAWFDAPLPGTIYWPPNPCLIVAHASSPEGIARFVLFINGAEVAQIPSPDTTSTIVTLTTECNLVEPGEYQLKIRAQDNAGNWSEPVETSLIIPGVEEEPEAFIPTITTGPMARLTPTTTLTTTTTPQPGSATIERISTDLVYIGRTGCGPMDVTITARITAPKPIVTVMIFHRFLTSGGETEFLTATLAPIGGGLYQVTLIPSEALGGSVPFDEATLQYQVIAQLSDGDTSVRTPLLGDIQVKACFGG
jgi:hypothetical protein